MKCPFAAMQNKVIDSRIKGWQSHSTTTGMSGLRKRFTTYEYVEDILPMVVKKTA